jgi:hypothetical protein
MTGQQTIELVGPLAKTFLFHRMTAREELGRQGYRIKALSNTDTRASGET